MHILTADIDGPVLMVSIGLSIVIIAIIIIIIRSVFKIETQVKNQRATIYLLMKLWEKQGATEEETSDFKKIFRIK
jgi:hypothetical protein